MTSKSCCYCPLKTNRRVDESGGTAPYVRVDELVWSDEQLQQGKLIKIRGFPKDHKLKLLGLLFPPTQPSLSPPTTDLKLQPMPYKMRVVSVGRLSEFHRLKQLTPVEACQGSKARIQANHIACALLVWSRLKMLAAQTSRTISQIQHGMLSDYLIEQLKHPSVQISLA